MFLSSPLSSPLLLCPSLCLCHLSICSFSLGARETTSTPDNCWWWILGLSLRRSKAEEKTEWQERATEEGRDRERERERSRSVKKWSREEIEKRHRLWGARVRDKRRCGIWDSVHSNTLKDNHCLRYPGLKLISSTCSPLCFKTIWEPTEQKWSMSYSPAQSMQSINRVQTWAFQRARLGRSACLVIF